MDPRESCVLREHLNPLETNFTCRGIARSKGYSRCRRKISIAACHDAHNLLEDMEANHEPGNCDTRQLRKLARLVLCKKDHQGQVNDVVREWSRKIREPMVHEPQRENQLLRMEIERLLENSSRLEEESTMQSARAASAMERVQVLEAEFTVLASELSDLRVEHAALTDRFHTRDLEHAASNDAFQHLPSEPIVSEAAHEAELELLATVRPDAQGREMTLRDELESSLNVWKESQGEHSALLPRRQYFMFGFLTLIFQTLVSYYLILNILQQERLAHALFLLVFIFRFQSLFMTEYPSPAPLFPSRLGSWESCQRSHVFFCFDLWFFVMVWKMESEALGLNPSGRSGIGHGERSRSCLLPHS